MIEFNNVCCGYEEKNPIFKNISINISDSKVTMILGPNGSGKTTLLKCLTHQIGIFSGVIKIDNINIGGISINKISRMIAYVPQNTTSQIDYQVLDFIAFGRTPYLGIFESPSEADYEMVFSFSSKYGLSKLLSKKMNTISGGERQLIYIMRALVQQTPIIVMDEPMSSLDFANQSLILDIVSQLANSGKTIVITSHNPNHALTISADVCLLDKHNHSILHGEAEVLLKDEKVLSNIFGDYLVIETIGKKSYITFKLHSALMNIPC